jgi:hypothetical protein
MSALVETAARQPRPGTLVREQARILWQRHRWELAIIGILLLLYLLRPLLLYSEVYRGPQVGRVWLPSPWEDRVFSDIALALMVTGIYFGLAVWRGESKGRRDYLVSRPVQVDRIILIRVTLGGLLLLAVILLTWFLWIAALRIRIPSLETHLPLGFLPDAGWGSLFLGGMNAYLLASLGALLSRDPVRWIALWLPLVVALLAAGTLNLQWTLLALPATAVLPPWGLLGGLGISLWDRSGIELLPAEAASLAWFAGLTLAVVLAARWRRQVA